MSLKTILAKRKWNHTMQIIRAILKYWLALAAAITILSALVYIAVQQSLRIGANDPQIQMAEDAAHALESGQSIESILPPGKIDIAKSLSPYLIIFGPDGSPLAANAVLHDQIPSLPAGVFEYTRQNGEDRITFQPEPGVRSATVIVPVAGKQAGFVMAGRSLREVEKRVDQLTGLVMVAWIAALASTLFLVVVFEIFPFTRSSI